MKRIVLIHDLLSLETHGWNSWDLSPDRRERAASLYNALETKRFLAAEYMTQRLIQNTFDVPPVRIIGKTAQKPAVVHDPPLFFSRSYSGAALCIGLDNGGSIGVDAELIQRIDPRIMTYFFTARERDFVAHAPDPDAAFAMIWTRKESYMKYTGEGLRFRMDLMDVTPHRKTAGLTQRPPQDPNSRTYYLFTYRINHMIVSVCSNTNNFPACPEEWSPYEKNHP